MRNPPPFMGGQGRTARDVRRDGHQAAFTLLMALLVVLGFLVRGCDDLARPPRPAPAAGGGR